MVVKQFEIMKTDTCTLISLISKWTVMFMMIWEDILPCCVGQRWTPVWPHTNSTAQYGRVLLRYVEWSYRNHQINNTNCWQSYWKFSIQRYQSLFQYLSKPFVDFVEFYPCRVSHGGFWETRQKAFLTLSLEKMGVEGLQGGWQTGRKQERGKVEMKKQIKYGQKGQNKSMFESKDKGRCKKSWKTVAERYVFWMFREKRGGDS